MGPFPPVFDRDGVNEHPPRWGDPSGTLFPPMLLHPGGVKWARPRGAMDLPGPPISSGSEGTMGPPGRRHQSGEYRWQPCGSRRASLQKQGWVTLAEVLFVLPDPVAHDRFNRAASLVWWGQT